MGRQHDKRRHSESGAPSGLQQQAEELTALLADAGSGCSLSDDEPDTPSKTTSSGKTPGQRRRHRTSGVPSHQCLVVPVRLSSWLSASSPEDYAQPHLAAATSTQRARPGKFEAKEKFCTLLGP